MLEDASWNNLKRELRGKPMSEINIVINAKKVSFENALQQIYGKSIMDTQKVIDYFNRLGNDYINKIKF